MSPLLAARNNCELVISFSDCLIDWGVDWWSGKGCLCVALLLGSGRVETVAGGCVCVLWANCEVLTALGGSGSLPITDPEPEAANKILLVIKCRSLFLDISRETTRQISFYPTSIDTYSYLWISMQHESKATLLKIKLALYNEYESEEILANSRKYKRIIYIYN